MKTKQFKNKFLLILVGGLMISTPFFGQNKSSEILQIFSGNTHSHSIYTSSHGAQWEHNPGATKFMEIDSAGVSHVMNSTLKKDWQKFQGPPSMHFSIAKNNGYDFYAVTDHSQEMDFYPTSVDNEAWITSKKAADEATNDNFVGFRGFEYSENDGPDGKGHINVYNSKTYLNALEKGNNLQSFYKWLETVQSAGNGPVVASFNHPGSEQYNNWDFRTPGATEVITMIELINSNNNIHYPAFINALEKGWKVSPICGNDNHGLGGITNNTSRTFVLASSKTKTDILDAMKNRRTYASLDNNIQCRYSVNGKMMGSTLKGETVFNFNISISDPDTTNPDNKITKIDIVKDNGEIAKTYEVTQPSYNVTWNPVIEDANSKYFFIRVWNAGGGDAPKADPKNPIAWLAPVWTDN